MGNRHSVSQEILSQLIVLPYGVFQADREDNWIYEVRTQVDIEIEQMSSMPYEEIWEGVKLWELI